MNNPTIVDIEELAAFLNELVAQQDNCPNTVSGWKEWLSEEIK